MSTSQRLEGKLEQSAYSASHSFMRMMNLDQIINSDGKYDAATKELAKQVWQEEFQKFKQANKDGIEVNKAIHKQSKPFFLRWF